MYYNDTEKVEKKIYEKVFKMYVSDNDVLLYVT